MSEKVCIAGLGYIGLPTAALAAGAGYNVIGVDVKRERVDSVNLGESSVHEAGVPELIREKVRDGRLGAASEPEPADFFIVAVPTPFRDPYQADLSFIEASMDAIAPHLRPGNTVIIESTAPSGPRR